ncbi:MAG: hypothetical protein JW772_00770 [Candidatus Diapherotrites archaeon]|nr:hypothetical protein [Candidatus Diapherotrites archaeon]
MNKTPIIVIFLVFVSMALLGCLESDFDRGIKRVEELRERYELGEQLAPYEPYKLSAFKRELENIKANSKDEALNSIVEIQLDSAEIIENVFWADLEIQRINTVDVDCNPESPLNTGINFLEKAFNKGDLAERRISAFENNYPDLVPKTSSFGLSISRIRALKEGIQEQLDSAMELKFLACT